MSLIIQKWFDEDLDPPVAVAVALTEYGTWFGDLIADFEEGRDDATYQQLIDAAAVPVDAPETRAFLAEDEHSVEFDVEYKFDQRVEDSVEFAAVIFEVIEDLELDPEIILWQQVDDVVIIGAEIPVEVIFYGEDDVEWAEEQVTQLIEAAVVVADDLETRVYLEWFAWIDETEDTYEVPVQSVEEIFDYVQLLFEDIQEEVEWVEEQLAQLIEDAAVVVDTPEARPFLAYEEPDEEYTIEDVLAQIIEESVVPPEPTVKPMGFFGVSFRKRKRQLVVEVDETADKQEVASFLQKYIEDGRSDLPEIEIKQSDGKLAKRIEVADFISSYLAGVKKIDDAQAEQEREVAKEKEQIELVEFLREFLKDTSQHGVTKTNFAAIIAAVLASEL